MGDSRDDPKYQRAKRPADNANANKTDGRNNSSYRDSQKPSSQSNKLNEKLAKAKGSGTRAERERATKELENEYGKATARRMIDKSHRAGW